MILSIIIPIYKAEKWLARCLDSVLKQLPDNDTVELVCVNDGSPDSSESIVRQYQYRYNNVVLINQDNQGVSAARNKGIANSTGEYLAFLDSDDEILDGAIPQLLQAIERNNDNIIVCRMFRNKEELIPWSDKFQEGNEYSAYNMINSGFLHGTACGCLIKKTLIADNDLHFPVGVCNGEDGFFFHSCLYYAGAVKFKDIAMYNVKGEEDSLSRSYSKERVTRMVISMAVIEKIIDDYKVFQDRLFILDYIKYSMLSGLVADCLHTKGIGVYYLSKQKGIKSIKLRLDNNVVFLRRKMVLMKHSFFVFYLLAWFKSVAKIS